MEQIQINSVGLANLRDETRTARAAVERRIMGRLDILGVYVSSAAIKVAFTSARLEYASPLQTMLQTSAAGVLALLSEPETVLKQHALKALLPLVPQFWAEISEHITAMCVYRVRARGLF